MVYQSRFVVRKKDGSKRFVVDLRGINPLIVQRLVQLPNIDELLQCIVEIKPRYFSLLDLRAAYWQLLIHENSRKYTAFSGPDGRRWQFRRAPYGLSTSPAQSLGVLGKIFADCNKYNSIAIYMDDTAVFTNKFDEYIKQLKLTLCTFRENRFSCNPKKTELACNRVEYLGFVLSADGRNMKALQRSLGLFNFWRKFVPSYSRNSFHMRQLLRKDVKFQCTKECDREIEYLKEALTKPPYYGRSTHAFQYIYKLMARNKAMGQLFYRGMQMAISTLYSMALKRRIQPSNSTIQMIWSAWR